eukprot:Pgem_evm1s17389
MKHATQSIHEDAEFSLVQETEVFEVGKEYCGKCVTNELLRYIDHDLFRCEPTGDSNNTQQTSNKGYKAQCYDKCKTGQMCKILPGKINPECSFKAHVPDSSSVSEDAIIGDNVKIGEGIIVAKGAQIGNSVVLEEGVNIGENVIIKSGSSVGKNVVLESNVILESNVEIGKGCNISEKTKIAANVILMENINIGKNVSIGTNNKVCPGVEISENVELGSDSSIGCAVQNNRRRATDIQCAPTTQTSQIG